MLCYVYTQRHKTGGKLSVSLLALVTLWLIAQGLEFAVETLEHKLIFANIQYIPITLIPIFYFFLALDFSRKDRIPEKKSLLPLFLIIPSVLNVLLWSDPWHGLIRQDLRLITAGLFPTVGKTFGPVMIPFALYNFSLTALTLFILGRAWADRSFQHRMQAKYLFIGLLVPMTATLLHLMGIDYHNIDATPYSFAITESLLTFGIFRYGLFDLMPVALSHVFEEMKPGMIVCDREYRLTDINPSARQMLDLKEQNIVGVPVIAAFAHVPELMRVIEKGHSGTEEISYRRGTDQYYYDVTVTELDNDKGISLGWMAQIYDVTERKKESISSESAFLRAQIKPHFLFNALNVIAVLCRVDPEKARELILDLSSYMRHSFDLRNLEKYIPFEEELDFIKAYVRIEEARFKDRLNMVYEIDDTQGLRLPPLLLQPLVENAIRHGIRKSKTGRIVILRVKNLREHYLIEVEDDGDGMTPKQTEMVLRKQNTGGVGLYNIQKRLEMLYGTQLSIKSNPSAGTKVTMLLPKRKETIE
jgi:PAS domain S-box-containing protein